MENKLDTSNPPKKESFEDKLKNSILESINDGRILGLKESIKALNGFLDKKIEMGYPEYISRNELNTFLETYVSESENNFNSLKK